MIVRRFIVKIAKLAMLSAVNPGCPRLQIYLPIADMPVNIFLVLGMGLAVGYIPACSVSAAAS